MYTPGSETHSSVSEVSDNIIPGSHTTQIKTVLQNTPSDGESKNTYIPAKIGVLHSTIVVLDMKNKGVNDRSLFLALTAPGAR